MAWVETRITRTSQPQDGVGIDLSNPLTLGLLSAVHPASYAAISPSGAVQRLGQNTAPAVGSRTGGRSLEFDGSNNSFTHPYTPSSNVNYTFVSWFYQNTSAVADKRIVSVSLSTASSSSHFSLGTGTSDGTRLKAFASNAPEGPSGAITNGVLKKAAARFSNTLEVFDSGVVVASNIPAISPTAFDRVAYGSLVRSTNTAVFNGGIVFGAVWNRALSDAEIKSLSNNPWQIFEPEIDRIWVDDAVTGGAVTGNASGPFSAVSLSPVSGTASGASVASGVFAPISLSPVTGTANGETVVTGNASGAFDDVALSPVSGTASGAASATGALNAVSLTAINGTASGEAIVAGNAAGAFDDVSLTALPASASGGSATGVRYWNGTTWEYGTLRYWGGSAWGTGVLRYWNGTNWSTP